MAAIKFKINGKEYTVDGKFGPDVSLNEYIRTVAELRGTKAMCHEGGCGACVVAVRAPLPPDNQLKTFAVNSCLVSVLSCHGWEVTTVEGIGNRIKGYHDIQSRLAKFNGTQCGFCTPGWVMNMYSLYESKNKTLTSVEVENSFASNMCRCTGYRPIADAFKTFAKDADQKLLDKLCDLEDLAVFKPCGLGCAKKCSHKDKCLKDDNNDEKENELREFVHVSDEKMLIVEAGNHKWYKAYNLSDVFKAMSVGDYKLVAGNTGQGIYHVTEYPTNVIDIFNVAEIKGHNIDVNLVLGAGMPLSEMMEIFLKLSAEKEEFSYLKQFYDHMDLVAHIPVRNIGTIGGNLYLKHFKNEFQSDVFLLFETVGAMVTIAESAYKDVSMKMTEFLKTPMQGKIIKNVMLPPLSHCCSVKTYKIMPRSQNAHAVVNAGYLFKFKENTNIVERASLVYGSISETFIHASKTEQALVGKDLFTNETLQLALKSLYDEIVPVEAQPEPSAAYRKMLAVTLFYKAILSLCPSDKMNPTYKSGGEAIKRHSSKGMQSFETDKSIWPLNQPIPKIEALVQCSGEAVFANDLPGVNNEVFAAFVTADTLPGSVIEDFDTSEAFKLPGVVAFYSAKDIPGDNVFTPSNIPYMSDKEEILCEKKVKFYGQPAGIIVADREKTANKAAQLVKIKYSSTKSTPLLSINQVLESPEKTKRVRADQTIEPTDVGHDVKTVIFGEMKLEEQYHYYMEPQTCVAKPTEDGMEVFSSTQWLDLVNVAVAQTLKVPVNSINVIVRRVGGAYGGKISRSAQVACSTALVTHLLNRTCRMILPMQTNMKSIGKRIPTKSNFEIMPRSQNAHAVVNAGYLFKFKENTNIVERASLVYGSISETFIHASKTEQALVGKDLFTNETLQLALKSLYDEIVPVEAQPEPSAAYRKMLAVTLFYKAILSLCPSDKMNPTYKSGGEAIKRHSSKGMQSFETDKSIWPLNQPIPKIEALVQCSGEAVFANDLPGVNNEVFAAFVTADTLPGSVIEDFDTSEAFKLPGVVAFYSAKDIPGDNVFTPSNIPYMSDKEEILCEKKVKFYGQPAGIIVADREKTANKAAQLVKIKYSSTKSTPLLSINQVLESPEKTKRVRADQTIEPTDVGHDVKTVIFGEMKLEEQYHYYMEPQTCVAKPTEDGMEVFSSTQWLDLVNVAVAQTLKVPVNSINVIVRRVGGAYGGKISRSAQVACSTALVTHLLNRTCRMILPMQTNMKSIGKRIPTKSNFEIGVNAQGEIQYLKNTFYQDGGCSYNETLTMLTIHHFYNCYNHKRWYISSNSVLTDKPSNTWCRAPFSAEGVAMIELIMERIAFSLRLDPIEVRLLNMVGTENNPIPELINQLRTDANYDDRKKQVEEFNKNNRWRKRAIKLIPLTVDIFYTGSFNAIVSIYHGDGSVVLTHGGIEMGQGINTKAAQVCAYALGIPLEKISVKPSNSLTSPNAIVTGGSVGSECVVFATKKACELLNEKLKPIREKMDNPSWEVLIEQAYGDGVDLQASAIFSLSDTKPYDVYAVGILELEVDILTGNHDILRVDILEDTGRSLSPEIDVAQIEGAFIMGLGYWTSEKMVYDGLTGKLLTDRTWTYKIPGIKDIPADMRIYFRRNGKNDVGVLQSKATGEPSLCLATVFLHAAHAAIHEARQDAGYEPIWFDLKTPCTVENIFMAVGHKLEHFKLK
uniref:Indole-3-acetaldehyde oxidase n=2 Tax=Heliothis virescens TaxID=7102 RepID=A0A2A4JYR8_HELVI